MGRAYDLQATPGRQAVSWDEVGAPVRLAEESACSRSFPSLRSRPAETCRAGGGGDHRPDPSGLASIFWIERPVGGRVGHSGGGDLIAVCGFKWQFLVAFIVELFPVVDIFPTWTALVLTLPSAGGVRAGPAPPGNVMMTGVARPSRPATGGEWWMWKRWRCPRTTTRAAEPLVRRSLPHPDQTRGKRGPNHTKSPWPRATAFANANDRPIIGRRRCGTYHLFHIWICLHFGLANRRKLHRIIFSQVRSGEF